MLHFLWGIWDWLNSGPLWLYFIVSDWIFYRMGYKAGIHRKETNA